MNWSLLASWPGAQICADGSLCSPHANLVGAAINIFVEPVHYLLLTAAQRESEVEASNTNRIAVRHGRTIPKQDAHFSSQGLTSICLSFCEKAIKEDKSNFTHNM